MGAYDRITGGAGKTKGVWEIGGKKGHTDVVVVVLVVDVLSKQEQALATAVGFSVQREV